jgi:hypothetical protein
VAWNAFALLPDEGWIKADRLLAELDDMQTLRCRTGGSGWQGGSRLAILTGAAKSPDRHVNILTRRPKSADWACA